MKLEKKLLTLFFLFLLGYSILHLITVYKNDYKLKIQIVKLGESITQLELEASKKSLLFEQNYKIEQKNKVILPEFYEIYSQNNDLVGWLSIDNTAVNYPVMQSMDDPQFYLSHDFKKEKNINGLPFLDERCDINRSSVLLIHGHNMKNGLIFGELMKYKEQSFYKKNPYIQFDTIHKKAKYEIIAVILSKVYLKSDNVFKYYQFDELNMEEGFKEYMFHIKELSLYETGIEAEFKDELIILSTCEYSSKNGRLAVIARKQ